MTTPSCGNEVFCSFGWNWSWAWTMNSSCLHIDTTGLEYSRYSPRMFIKYMEYTMNMRFTSSPFLRVGELVRVCRLRLNQQPWCHEHGIDYIPSPHLTQFVVRQIWEHLHDACLQQGTFMIKSMSNEQFWSNGGTNRGIVPMLKPKEIDSSKRICQGGPITLLNLSLLLPF
jgi:hypothetical protein